MKSFNTCKPRCATNITCFTIRAFFYNSSVQLFNTNRVILCSNKTHDMWQVLQAVARLQHYHPHTFRPAQQLKRTRLCHAILYPSSCPYLPLHQPTWPPPEQNKMCVTEYELNSQYVSRQRGKFAL